MQIVPLNGIDAAISEARYRHVNETTWYDLGYNYTPYVQSPYQMIASGYGSATMYGCN